VGVAGHEQPLGARYRDTLIRAPRSNEVAEKYQGRLQIVAADNTVPERAREYIRVRFTEDEKLIPTHLLGG